jgi:hypothetical protein
VQGRCGGDAGGCAGGGFGLSLSGGARHERAVERFFVVLDAMPSGKARGGGGGGGGEEDMARSTQNRKFDCVARCRDIGQIHNRIPVLM